MNNTCSELFFAAKLREDGVGDIFLLLSIV